MSDDRGGKGEESTQSRACARAGVFATSSCRSCLGFKAIMKRGPALARCAKDKASTGFISEVGACRTQNSPGAHHTSHAHTTPLTRTPHPSQHHIPGAHDTSHRTTNPGARTTPLTQDACVGAELDGALDDVVRGQHPLHALGQGRERVRVQHHALPPRRDLDDVELHVCECACA